VEKSVEKYFSLIKQEEINVLNYLKANYPFFHKSNVFYRDIQFGLKHYLKSKDINISYTESELLANEFINHLTMKNILKKIDFDVYLLNYPEFAVKRKELTTKS